MLLTLNGGFCSIHDVSRPGAGFEEARSLSATSRSVKRATCGTLIHGLRTEVAFAIDRFQGVFLHLIAFEDFNRHVDTRVPGGPKLRVEILLTFDRLTANADDHITFLKPCEFCRT